MFTFTPASRNICNVNKISVSCSHPHQPLGTSTMSTKHLYHVHIHPSLQEHLQCEQNICIMFTSTPASRNIYNVNKTSVSCSHPPSLQEHLQCEQNICIMFTSTPASRNICNVNKTSVLCSHASLTSRDICNVNKTSVSCSHPPQPPRTSVM